MTPEIKNMKTWDEAFRWLAKHGWGLALIEEQKIEWDKANPPTPEPKTVEVVKQKTTTPATKTTPATEPKTANTAKTE